METAIALPDEEGSSPDSLQRILVLVGLGYAALVCLAFYAEYKIQMRRARKRREAKERKGRQEPPDVDSWFQKDGPSDGNRPS